jgi:dienelactone hydrolase
MRRTAVLALAAVLLAGGGAACARPVVPGPAIMPAAAPAAEVTRSTAPAEHFAVGVRHLDLGRGPNRPLPTIIWYPALSEPGRTPPADPDMALGRFPLVLFSHGLNSLPEEYQPLTTRWAAAGFVVAAPAYPFTHKGTHRFDRLDTRNQPADAAYVISQVARLDATPGDAFAGRLDTDRVCAAGHSAGGHTTSGMFTPGRDIRLRCGIVIAGAGLDAVGGDGRYRGPAAALLFVHGDNDTVVPYARGRAAYDRVPWAKAFLTLRGRGHGEFLSPNAIGFTQTLDTTTDFLRWALYGDATARHRLATDSWLPGVTTLSDALGV